MSKTIFFATFCTHLCLFILICVPNVKRNKFFDPSTPSMRNIDDGEKKKEKKKRRKKKKKKEENNSGNSGH